MVKHQDAVSTWFTFVRRCEEAVRFEANKTESDPGSNPVLLFSTLVPRSVFLSLTAGP